MTREEAIAELNVLHERLSNPKDCEDGCYSWEDGWYVEAIDMAIEALQTAEINCVNCPHYYETEDDTGVHGHCEPKFYDEDDYWNGRIPTIQADRPPGEWVHHEIIETANGETIYNIFVCDQCGSQGHPKMNFCPNCGCVMDMGGDSNDKV